jgi:hypothetical protein
MAVKTIVDAREHVIYTGITQSGKTTLARFHARILAKAGYDVVAYDPVLTATAGGGWPEKTLILTTPKDLHLFLDKARGTDEHPIFLFVDEAPDIFAHTEVHSKWIPRKVRHQKIFLRLLATRPLEVHPGTRSACTHCYMFMLDIDDAKQVAKNYAVWDQISEIKLDRGDFLFLQSGSRVVESANVFELVT